MRRAVRLSLLALSLVVLLPAAAFARDAVDGAGMIDYHRPADLKVGTWVKYRMQSSSLQGYKDDYTITILIAGEEEWWGEPCFWVETWTQDAGERKLQQASLLPYSMFGDSMATKHVTWFLRKSISGLGPDGTPQQVIHRRDEGELTLRAGAKPQTEPVEMSRDTLGRDSTSVPAGRYPDCTKIRSLNRIVEQVTKGDSSIYYERNEERMLYMTRQVPITSLARDDVDDHQLGRSWRLGESQKAGELKTLERARGSLVLVETGTGGLTPELVPEKYRRPLREQEAAQKAAPKPKPATKKTTRSG